MFDNFSDAFLVCILLPIPYYRISFLFSLFFLEDYYELLNHISHLQHFLPSV